MLASSSRLQISNQRPLSVLPPRSFPSMTSPNHIFASSAKAPNFEEILSRLQRLTLTLPSQSTPSLASPSFPRQPLSATMSYHDLSPPCSPSGFTLDAPFSMSYPHPKWVDDDLPVVIDTFAPRALSDLSPTSSTSSEYDSVSSHHTSLAKSSFEAFVATRSRVVRLYNLPPSAEAFLSVVFLPQTNSRPFPIPVTMWVVREDYSGARPDCVWAVFKCHEEACAALSLSGAAMSVAAALESDLKPFHKLRRFELRAPAPTASPQSPPSSAGLHTSNMLHISSSHTDLHAARSVLNAGTRADYTISSNPPNPRTSFRLGDWICSSPKCAAHNFGRNLACIGCGCPRTNAASSPQYQTPTSPTRLLSFPRFVSSPSFPTSFSPVSPTLPSQSYCSPPKPPSYPSPQMPHPVLPSAKTSHPLLTPSGRAFARGGKVQNVSSDPLSPCIMYWPDNETFPEQGQIRPSGLMGVQQPPILNTGNRGPISHQPGDWICLKCNYLNWRRRKVCQTCLPYAEGNGDSISAAVQAERIALLTSVLTHAQSPPAVAMSPPSNNQRSQSLTPPQSHRPFVDISPPISRGPVHRSQSHFELSTQYANASPIYQTSGARQPSPPHSPGQGFQVNLHAPAPLLPSFLQDIIQSPNLSPASTSSADLSFEEYEDSLPSSTPSTYARTRNSSDKSSLGNIWRLDGEESKSLSAFALPNHQELMGGSRKNSQEKLRLQVATS